MSEHGLGKWKCLKGLTTEKDRDELMMLTSHRLFVQKCHVKKKAVTDRLGFINLCFLLRSFLRLLDSYCLIVSEFMDYLHLLLLDWIFQPLTDSHCGFPF